MPEKEVVVGRVEATMTRNGNTRYVLRDADGGEYTTFKEAIARDALAAEGKRARIAFHTQERNGFTNVYLDGVTVLDGDDERGEDAAAAEVAWGTAVEAAPWLLGSNEPSEAVGAEELYETLKPFKDLVAEDIEDADR
jgi:hypothetical protein